MLEGKVIRVLSPTEIVINLGSKDGVTESTRFVVFALGDEITDPETGESLGQLEIVKGKAEVKHPQPNFTTLQSAEKKKVNKELPRVMSAVERRAVSLGVIPDTYIGEVEITAEFDNVAVGDRVREL